jgi:hypothetical protein
LNRQQPKQQAVIESTTIQQQATFEPDEPEKNFLTIRNNTRTRQSVCADASLKNHDRKRNKTTRTYEVSDYVPVKSPRIDRHGTDYKLN